MRLKTKLKKDHKEGDTMNKTAFLWLPKKIGNEFRWLERATWQLKYMSQAPLLPIGQGYSPSQRVYGWVAIKWV